LFHFFEFCEKSSERQLGLPHEILTPLGLKIRFVNVKVTAKLGRNKEINKKKNNAL